MRIQVIYSNWEERQSVVAEKEAEGLTMLHDDFAPDWKHGDEPHGTLTFTDEPRLSSPMPEPMRDLGAEIDDLKARLEKLEPLSPQ